MTYSPSRRTSSPTFARGAADFLHSHEKMAAIVPAVSRLVALRKDCAAILPSVFEYCNVMQHESDQLVLGVPNAAFASRLKQQLPQLRSALLKRGWKIDTIRIKVQLPQDRNEAARPDKQLALSSPALAAFTELSSSLDRNKATAGLHEAVARLIARHRRQEG